MAELKIERRNLLIAPTFTPKDKWIQINGKCRFTMIKTTNRALNEL